MADTAPPAAPTVDPASNGSTGNITISFEETMVAYGSLYVMAVFCIVLGSIRSVDYVLEHIREKKLIEASITTKEAKRFPFTASAVLFGLYVFFKYGDTVQAEVVKFLFKKTVDKVEDAVDIVANATNVTAAVSGGVFSYLPKISKENAMVLLLVLLCWEGSVALAHLLKPLFTAILSRLPIDRNKQPRANLPYEINFTRGKKDSNEVDHLIEWKFDTHDLVSVAVCSLVGISHIYRRHWISNDLIGCAFSLYGIEQLHLASFKGGVLLLAGLFVYDVFWVFATDVMTTVATGINAPILLQFPQDLFQMGWQAKKHAMLGLGDIVIPGIFVALLRRFDCRVLDHEDGKKKKQSGEKKKARFYFLTTMVAYAAGLTLTIVIMHIFKAAQPALLYLVPACVGVPVALAAIRGELPDLWSYSEEHLVKKDDEKKEEKKEETKNATDKKKN